MWCLWKKAGLGAPLSWEGTGGWASRLGKRGDGGSGEVEEWGADGRRLGAEAERFNVLWPDGEAQGRGGMLREVKWALVFGGDFGIWEADGSYPLQTAAMQATKFPSDFIGI